MKKFGIIYIWLNLLNLQTALAIMCYICGQTNLPPPGECTTQFQYDCSIADPNQQQGRNDRSKMTCRTTRSRVNQNSYSVSKECVSEDEHLSRYPDGKAFGCETIFPNSTNEISYCICDQDLCNGRTINEQIQASPPQQQGSFPFLQGGVNIAVGAPVGSENVQVGLQPPFAQDQGLLLPAPPPLTPQLPANINEFGRTPPGTQLGPSLPENSPGILVPLILPNNSLLLPPFLSSSAPQPVPTRILNPGSIPQPVVIATQQNQQPNLAEQKPPSTFEQNAAVAIHLQPEPNVPGVQTTVPGRQLRPSFNSSSLEQIQGESFVDQNQRNVQSHVKPNDDVSLTCVTCAETNLSAGADCRKQVPIDCSRQFSSESKIFCFTKDTLLPTGLHTVEKRCVSDEILTRELGLQVVRESCGQTTPKSPIEFQYCICTSESCNQISLQQQLVLYANALQSQPVQVQNQWVQHLQQQLSGRPLQQNRTTSESRETSTVPEVNGTKCYVCGEADLQHASDCSQQYEYNCNRQYPSSNIDQHAKILCLTRQTKLPNGLFSIEKRCMAESEHKQQYPGAAQVVLNGCGEAWNGYVQYCVCADSDLCNGPNITIQQYHRGYTPTATDSHQQTDPFSTLPRSTTTTATSSTKLTNFSFNSTTTSTETKPTTTFNPKVPKKPADLFNVVDDPEHQQRKTSNASSKQGVSEHQKSSSAQKIHFNAISIVVAIILQLKNFL